MLPSDEKANPRKEGHLAFIVTASCTPQGAMHRFIGTDDICFYFYVSPSLPRNSSYSARRKYQWQAYPAHLLEPGEYRRQMCYDQGDKR